MGPVTPTARFFLEENTDETQATDGRTDKETNRLSDIVPT